MNRTEFRVKFSESVAESDFDICECRTDKNDISDITNDGLTRLTDIAEGVAEPLFETLGAMQAALRKIANIEANRFPDTSTWRDLAKEAIGIACAALENRGAYDA